MKAIQKYREFIANRLIEWMKSSPHKPANIAFTEEPLRQIGYTIEDVVDEAESSGRIKGLEEAANISDQKGVEENNLMENTNGELGEPLRIGMAHEIAAAIRALIQEAKK